MPRIATTRQGQVSPVHPWATPVREVPSSAPAGLEDGGWDGRGNTGTGGAHAPRIAAPPAAGLAGLRRAAVRASSITILLLAGLLVLYHGGNDFWVFWAAARVASRSGDPYLSSSLAQAPRPSWMGAGLLFFSPPYLTAWFWPLSRLPFAVAWWVWSGLMLSAVGCLTVLLPRLAGFRASRRTAAIMLGGLCALTPFWNDLNLGQLDLFTVAALAASWWCLTKGRPFLAGLVVIAGVPDPQLATGFAAYYLVRSVARREYALAAGMAAGLGVDGALCLAHPGLVADWLRIGLPAAQRLGSAYPLQVTVLRLAALVASPHTPWRLPPHFRLLLDQYRLYIAGARVPRAAVVAAGAMDLAALVAAVRVWLDPRHGDPATGFAVAAVLTLITATFAYNFDYLLLLLTVPALLRWERHTDGRSRRVAMAIALGTLVAGLDLSSAAPGPNVLGAGFAMVWTLWALRRRRAVSPGAAGGLLAAWTGVVAAALAWRWAASEPLFALVIVAAVGVPLTLVLPARRRAGGVPEGSVRPTGG